MARLITICLRMGDIMKEYKILLVEEKIQGKIEKVLDSYDVEGIELEYCWKEHTPRRLFSGVFPLAGKDGIGFSFCVEVPHNKLKANKTEHKTKVFFDDCLEIFLQPENSSIYYGIELNGNGTCLDYRVFIHENTNGDGKVILPKELEKSLAYDGGEKIFGYFTDKVALETLTFDYDWKANGTVSSEVKDEYWMLEVFIPWSDFGLEKAPKEGTVWRGTLNRIDSSLPRGTKQGFLCLLDEPEVISFHQPKKFAAFTFEK